MPKELDEGVLYLSEEFGVAAHLCPCGCKNKIVTPIGPVDWSFSEINDKPTLHPSIGNWQLPCRSHYWIINGDIKWSYPWTEKQIKAGRKEEEKLRKTHYKKRKRQRLKKSILYRIASWFRD